MAFMWTEEEKHKEKLDCEAFKKKYNFFNSFFNIDFNEKVKQKSVKFCLGYYTSNFLKIEDKHYTLKTFYINKSEHNQLLEYFNALEILSRRHKNIMKILNYCIDEKTKSILVILDKKWNTLDFHRQTLSEIELILVLRKMMDMLFGLEFDSAIFKMMNALGVKIWDMRNMCYYRKFWQKRRRLPNYKLKVDFLNFVDTKKIDQSATMNLNELAEFIRDFMPLSQLSLPIRHLVMKIEEKNQNITINDLREHPLFLMHKYQKINFEKWKIQKGQKEMLRRGNSTPKSPEDLTSSQLRFSTSKKNFIATNSPEKIKYLKKNSKILRSRIEKSKENSHQHFERVQEILHSAKSALGKQFTTKKLDQYVSHFIDGFLESELKKLKQKRYRETQVGNDAIKYFLQNPKQYNLEKLLKTYQIIPEDDYRFMLEAKKKGIY